MSAAPLRQISITTSPEAEEAVVELLQRRFNSPPASLYDRVLDETVVSVYLREGEEWKPSMRSVLKRDLAFLEECGLDIGPGTVRVIKVPHENWAESWKKHFKPLEIGPGLLIKPSWSRKKPKEGQALVVLDPGLSFGTGRHATTSFCLNALVEARKEGEEQAFLDIGCGSGILSICAAKMGYRPVAAFDVDPEAVRVCRGNAEMNGVAGLLSVKEQDLETASASGRRKYHVVCANLMYDLLLAERDRIIARLRKGGVLALAGILTERYAEVRDHYQAAGLEEVATRIDGEWQSGSFLR
jgi:ribosomal protein L11 methyltransferase